MSVQLQVQCTFYHLHPLKMFAIIWVLESTKQLLGHQLQSSTWVLKARVEVEHEISHSSTSLLFMLVFIFFKCICKLWRVKKKGYNSGWIAWKWERENEIIKQKETPYRDISNPEKENMWSLQSKGVRRLLFWKHIKICSVTGKFVLSSWLINLGSFTCN